MLALFAGGCGSSLGPADGGAGKGGHAPTGGGATGGGAGTDGGAACSPASCQINQYCATCGEHAGQCVPGPADCIYEALQIVCGCNGKLYRSPCQANLERIEVSTSGGCETPPGKFRCGTVFCTPGTQYCQVHYTNDVRDAITGGPYIYGYSCGDLPAGCGATPTCACVTSTECGDCTVSADGDLTTMCSLTPG